MADPSVLDSTLRDSSGVGALDATHAAGAGALDSTHVAPPTAALATPLDATQSLKSTLRPSVLPSLVGETLSLAERPRYETQRILGEGGMGQVTLAFDHDIGRQVAIKQLLPVASRDTAGVARFVEEIRTVGALEHPGIVPIHDVGVDDKGAYFFVMKKVDGETLESIIERLAAGDARTHAEYTFTRRAEITMGVLRALEYAHEKGIIHRDIKPANVMVGAHGEVVLMDWGIAKPKSAPERPESPALARAVADSPTASRARLYTTRHGALVGTPAYMSPEQARGENDSIDERSDLYSLGVMLFELMTTRHYLDEEKTMEAMLAKIASRDDLGIYGRLGAHTEATQGAVPPEWRHIIAALLRKDPATRLQSATETLERFERCLAGTFPVQCPLTMVKRGAFEVGHFVSRRPNVGFFAVLGVLLLVLASFIVSARALLHG